MKAMIFAAGLGTRLKPLTDSTPKALLPINGKPMLEHVILKLKDAGFHQIAIHNVDILSDIDLRALYNHHIETNPLATLLVSKRNTSRYLLFNKENKLCGWRNRETGEVKSFYPDFDPNQRDTCTVS